MNLVECSKRRALCLLGLSSMLSSPLAWAQSTPPATVMGAGATFPAEIYRLWSDRYKSVSGVTVQYQPTGSGDGTRQMGARKVAFGGTDSPLKPADLVQRQLLQLPTVAGAVVPVFNLRSLGDRSLQLTGDVLADLFAGKITRWNDPQIAALNPGLALPDLPVRRIVRADASGTTDAFTRYLSQVNASFRSSIGAGQKPQWPGEPLAAEGNGGVVKLLQSTEGGLAYVGYDRVIKERLSAIILKNTAGQWVTASEESVRRAIMASDVHRLGDDSASTINLAAPGSWPITVITFVLVDAEPARAADAQPALRFLYWAFMQGDALVKGTGFVSLPVMLQARLAGRLMAVKPRDGQTIAYF